MPTKYSGADWLKQRLSYEKRNPSKLGCKVADVLGQVTKGLYHMSDKSLMKCNWENQHYIEINWTYSVLSSWDFPVLTTLLVMCFDNGLRFEILPCNMQMIKVIFYSREVMSSKKDEFISCNHLPILEDVIDKIRSNFSLKGDKDED